MALSASRRIDLLKGIAERLAAEDWPLIDVTLRQFHLPSSDEWGGTKQAYVLRMTDSADDEVLVELAQHVGLQVDDNHSIRVDPPFWRSGMFRLFISHLATHRSYAAELQESLLRYGISGFVAHNDIEPTSEWQTQIETALATCDALIALLHSKFHDSYWTDQEIGFAMGRGVPVFAISFDQVPYGFIGRFQAFKGKKKDANQLSEELFDAYRKNKQTQRRMSEVIIGLFEQSNSFADAKSRMDYLEELEFWQPSFSTRIRAAMKANSQISGSWGVPERAKSLLRKWKSD